MADAHFDHRYPSSSCTCSPITAFRNALATHVDGQLELRERVAAENPACAILVKLLIGSRMSYADLYIGAPPSGGNR
jgi:hypothetical protein